MSPKNPVTPQGIDPGTIRLIAQRYIIFFVILGVRIATAQATGGPITNPQQALSPCKIAYFLN